MELRQLRYFQALSETLNFHRAAAKLNMSQPPLSVSIRKLEDELGVVLFDRESRGVRLTPAGEAALPHVRDVLGSVERMAEAVRETASGARGRLRVGFVGSATYALIPAIVPAFRRRHPRIELGLKEATSLEVARAVDAGELDMGILRTPLFQAGDLELDPLYREDLILITSKDHALAGSLEVRLEDLSNEAFVAYDQARAPNLWGMTMMACETAGFHPIVAEEAAHIHTMIALVESGLGVALAPSIMRRVGPNRVGCAKLTLAGRALQVGMALATRPGERRPATTAFATIAREASLAFDS